MYATVTPADKIGTLEGRVRELEAEHYGHTVSLGELDVVLALHRAALEEARVDQAREADEPADTP